MLMNFVKSSHVLHDSAICDLNKLRLISFKYSCHKCIVPIAFNLVRDTSCRDEHFVHKVSTFCCTTQFLFRNN